MTAIIGHRVPILPCLLSMQEETLLFYTIVIWAQSVPVMKPVVIEAARTGCDRAKTRRDRGTLLLNEQGRVGNETLHPLSVTSCVPIQLSGNIFLANS